MKRVEHKITEYEEELSHASLSSAEKGISSAEKRKQAWEELKQEVFRLFHVSERLSEIIERNGEADRQILEEGRALRQYATCQTTGQAEQ